MGFNLNPFNGQPIDPTPGFGAVNVLKTQTYNLTGHQAPGYNIPGIKGQAYINPGQEVARAGGKIYNAGGDVIGTYDTGAPQPNADTTSTNYPGYTLGATTLPSAQDIAANNQAIGLANSALGRLPNQLETALGNIKHQYDQNSNELQSGWNAAHQQYGLSSQQNQQQFVGNKNLINDGASQGIRSLRSTLAQHGAGGSSAALYAAPDAVGHLAAQQRAGAGQTFGQNQQALDTNFNTYQSGFDNSKKQLADWLTQQQDSARSNSESNRINLLQQLAALQSSPTDAQPYIDKINAAASHVDQLAKFDPTYTGSTPLYNAPDVASYTVNQAAAPQLGNPGNGTGAGSPLAFLLGLKDKNQQQIA